MCSTHRHEHHYVDISDHLIQSDKLSHGLRELKDLIGKPRIILCTLSTLSTPSMATYGVFKLVPVERLRPGDFILVDPLDGTREFVDRNGEFAISIGLVSAGEAKAGAVFAPAFPYQGRVTRGGVQHARDAQGRWSAVGGDIVTRLHAEGVPARPGRLDAPLPPGLGVFDAETPRPSVSLSSRARFFAGRLSART